MKRNICIVRSRDDAEWLSRIGAPLRKKLIKVRLLEPLPSEIIPTFAEWSNSYIRGRKDIKPRTVEILEDSVNALIAFYGRDRLLTDFTEQDAADFRIYLLGRGLAEATVRGRCRKVKQIFAAAKKKRLIEQNPFDDIPTADRVNKSRQRFIDRPTINKVIEACPNLQWQLIFVLARYLGLRIPSELDGLMWDDVLWDDKKIRVHSPKTEHIEGRASRLVPLFPEVEPFLLKALQEATPGQSKIITIYGKNNSNLRTQAQRIIKRAGFELWPKPFHNLRASCETELVEKFPVHVVTAWLGNSPEIATKHYLQVTEDHYREAVKVAQNPAQQPIENTRKVSQEAFYSILKKLVSPDIFRALQKVAESFDSAENQQTPRRGLEPRT
jgi:integrase